VEARTPAEEEQTPAEGPAGTRAMTAESTTGIAAPATLHGRITWPSTAERPAGTAAKVAHQHALSLGLPNKFFHIDHLQTKLISISSSRKAVISVERN